MAFFVAGVLCWCLFISKVFVKYFETLCISFGQTEHVLFKYISIPI